MQSYPNGGYGQQPPLSNANPGDPYLALATAKLAQTTRDIARAYQPYADVVPDGALVINALSVAGPATSALQSLLWPCTGYLVGVSATSEDGTQAGANQMFLRILVDGTIDAFVSNSGSGPGFAGFSQLNGMGNGFTFSLRRPFRAGVAWQCSVKNVAASTLIADVSFWYVATDR